jgi:hypothetical protein
VVEWGPKGPIVRCSTEDDAMGDAVAVGGLYEVEELIADEIDPLPYVPVPKPDLQEAASGVGEATELNSQLEASRSATGSTIDPAFGGA